MQLITKTKTIKNISWNKINVNFFYFSWLLRQQVLFSCSLTKNDKILQHNIKIFIIILYLVLSSD